MLVAEMIPEETGKILSEKLNIPVIGIGAGRYTDGQVLVIDDIIGKYSDFTPKFAKKYADTKSIISDSVKKYISEVKHEVFPSENNIFSLKQEEKEKFEDTFRN